MYIFLSGSFYNCNYFNLNLFWEKRTAFSMNIFSFSEKNLILPDRKVVDVMLPERPPAHPRLYSIFKNITISSVQTRFYSIWKILQYPKECFRFSQLSTNQSRNFNNFRIFSTKRFKEKVFKVRILRRPFQYLI